MSLEKTVKLACKPKAAPPKSKYVDPIIAATYSSDGAIHDICRALGGRLREPNSVVVFKALIVLHQMIRSGSTDNVLSYLSKTAGTPGDVLRLRNVVAQAWDGYSPPANLGYYAQYLDARIRGYRDLKHDPVRVQAESNRRSSYDGSSGKARKLRALTVDKGLLRETKQVLKMVDALVQCKLYEDHLEDECTVTALRMMVKDLLVLTQAVNEGVINVLEHYFEMSKIDATEALSVYKAFCKQSDNVVTYLGTARKLHQLLDVPVPNLKHAPVSLVAALEEYLNDPNFEQNRLEYKRNMAIAEGKPVPPAETAPKPAVASTPPPPRPAEASSSASAAKAASPPQAQKQVSKSIQDFFESIEAEQGTQQHPTGFNMPMQPMQTGMPNPFRQSMMFPQATGFIQPMPLQPQFTASPWGQQGAGPMQSMPTGFMQNQPSGFLQPQATGWANPSSPGNQVNMPAPWGMSQQQSSAAQSPLHPQVTGAPNPFRHSMMFPQLTGMVSPAAAHQASPVSADPSGHLSGATPAAAKPLITQPTGSKNPFAPLPGAEPKKVPEGPSLFELSLQRNGIDPSGLTATSRPQEQQASSQANQSQTHTPSGGFISELASAFAVGGGAAGSQSSTGLENLSGLSIGGGGAPDANGTGANSFAAAFGNTGPSNHMQPQATGYAGSTVKPFQPSSGTSFLQPQQTGFAGSSVKPFQPDNSIQPQQTGFAGSSVKPFQPDISTSTDFLRPQATGFAGSAVKPFKPASNFGSTLVDSLPPLPASPMQSPTTQTPPPLQTNQTGFNPFGPASGTSQASHPTGNQNSNFMQAFGVS